MLDTLFVNNYRNLKDFKISALGRVNLITGKNNTGKSTLLEAIAIYATRGDLSIIYDLLNDRGESFKLYKQNETSNSLEANIKKFSSLFANRFIGYEKIDAITISITESTLSGELYPDTKSVKLRFVKFFDEMQKDEAGSIIKKRAILEGDLNDQFPNYKIGFEISHGNSSYILPLDESASYRLRLNRIGDDDNLQFLRTRHIDREVNGKLWDNITLTEKEAYVIEALKIIEPSTERIAFIEENSGERSAVIKLANTAGILPLRSMGDGINRILTIILALINADNGFLLIDEFENGLHYTVQEKLWNVIFSLAEKLNVQVFVTTHSEDCITGFERILNSPSNKLAGKLIRLDNDNGVIKQVEFNAKELKIATDQHIETR